MRAAFDAAVERHGATVLRVCRAVLGPGPDADDAWSETFLSALRAWPDLPEDTNVEAWLVRVAHRRAVDVIRGSVRAASPPGGGGGRVDDDNDTAAYTDTDAYTAVAGAELWAEVAKLPPKQRMCVAYRYLGGLSYAEIAEIVGGSESAARRAAADGVAALRRKKEALGVDG